MRLLRLAPDRDRHEDLFLEHYATLRRHALALTGQDAGLAEDLLHDAFIQFTLIRPPLDRIQYLEAYLTGMLRNMHASYVRRAARRGFASIPLEEFPFLGSHAPALAAAEAREELSLLCRYACLRKESSKAGSILILRFVLGYFPSEIARIARLSAHAVDVWLQLARREARLFRDEPEKLAFLRHAGESGRIVPAPLSTAGEPDDVLRSLRERVYAAKSGRCLSSAALKRTYEATQPSAIATAHLAHLVSCPRCLGVVCELLSIGPPSDRFPGESSSARRRGGSPRRSRDDRSDTVRRDGKRRTIFEHRPEELSVAVNGLELTTCTVGQRTTRQALTVNVNEPMAFVEVFSVDGLRLLFANVDPFPSGPVEQSVRLDLSDDRSLQVTVQFREPWPLIEILYNDPHWIADADVLGEDAVNVPAVEHDSIARVDRSTPLARLIANPLTRVIAWLVARPRTLATATMVLLLAALIASVGPSTVWAAVYALGRDVLRALGVVRVVEPPAPPRVAPTPIPAPAPAVRPSAARIVLTPPLASIEADVLARLDRIGALLGQEALVSRRAGRVVVRAYGASEARRADLTQALQDVRARGQLILLLDPPSNAHATPAAPTPLPPQTFAASTATYPLQQDVERVLLARDGTPADAAALDRDARALAVRVLDDARAVRLHAGVMRDVALRFTAQDDAAMNADTRAAWRAIVRDHAREVQRAVSALDEALAPWLHHDDAAATTKTDAGAERLFTLATSIDTIVCEAFATGSQSPTTLRISTGMFKAALAEARAIAGDIQNNHGPR
jgi:DNA-directed RNA polymerase specialized sigma24 family protein